MNDEIIREEEFKIAAVDDHPVGEQPEHNLSNGELRELLHQHVGIL